MQRAIDRTKCKRERRARGVDPAAPIYGSNHDHAGTSPGGNGQQYAQLRVEALDDIRLDLLQQFCQGVACLPVRQGGEKPLKRKRKEFQPDLLKWSRIAGSGSGYAKPAFPKRKHCRDSQVMVFPADIQNMWVQAISPLWFRAAIFCSVADQRRYLPQRCRTHHLAKGSRHLIGWTYI